MKLHGADHRYSGQQSLFYSLLDASMSAIGFKYWSAVLLHIHMMVALRIETIQKNDTRSRTDVRLLWSVGANSTTGQCLLETTLQLCMFFYCFIKNSQCIGVIGIDLHSMYVLRTCGTVQLSGWRRYVGGAAWCWITGYWRTSRGWHSCLHR